MNTLMDIIKGMLIGIANIIPGVSGGTMALSMGIYDKLIGAVSNLFKDFKKSVMTLLPILIGCAIGIIGFTYIIEYLLTNHTYLTCMAFIGLILGGLPMLVRQLRDKLAKRGGSIGVSGAIAFLALFAVAVAMPLLGSDEAALTTLTASPGMMVSLFFIGIIASATMVVPGVSGSMVLMILGYYYGILGSIKNFLEGLKAFDFAAMFHEAMLLVPFGIGVLLGIFLIAKLITFLFERYGVQTYCAILGLILSSPFAIFYNTGLLAQLGGLNAMILASGVLVAAVCAIAAYFLGEK
ncbi:MAG TPA: DUF368 domain-containing protein [Candidatus Ventrimonas merdavium]|nr:DUF368 domain-containing protein [Candidatus Ventrimonas merdavium]